ncbi:MAG TPA: hypothetical protein VFG68_13100 [Fimbriiglobus sp.]|nr:hypothetical protein [Fimbriiglobus sp.]
MTAITNRVRWRRFALAGVVLAAVLYLFGYWWWRDRYPYGWSHCCDKQLSMALRWYADEHGGAFPAGGGTPEASLGLLYSQYANPNLLELPV